MPNGKLTVELKTGFSALPIDQCVFRLKSKSGEILSEQIITPPTGGVSQTVTIDAPIKALSLDSGSKLQPYSVCDAELQTKHYYKMLFENVQIFDTINSQLCVEMVPLPSSIPNSESAITIIFDIPAHSLYKPSDEKKESVENVQAPPKKETMFSKKTNVLPAINIIGGVYIPETITVHLGKPSELAENVTVPFLEYVKNVASSEIYPTWPQESLKANIHAQISLALNRIYTEWYRSKGYNFDITNSTAYDQYFVYGRNIFDSVSVIADEIFNTYLVKPYGVEPYYAEYCNGTTSTCAGMSQWGTVSLAKDGLSADEILRFYYPDIEITGTDNIRAITESYPGTPLKIGNTGEDVRIMQEQLNRIAINFPQIPLIRS
ncbi:MAG: spore cortex-lytic protein, partial [Clostridia bacterium]